MDGVPRPEYAARGTVYVEALRGRDFSLRLTNPLGVSVAVALSVDGLNTIDAKHTSAKEARKWVLDPYQTVVIPGWQVSGETSRKFYFTGEKGSYGATLGQTSNLGTIEAVFFRERLPYRSQGQRSGAKEEEKISSNEKREVTTRGGAGSPAPPRRRQAPHGPSEADLPLPLSSSSLSDELAATGIGRRTRFE